MAVTEAAIEMFNAGKKRGMSNLFGVQFFSSILAAAVSAFCSMPEQVALVFAAVTLCSSGFYIAIQ